MSFSYADAVEFEKKATKRGSVLGLLSIKRLMDELGNHQEELQIIHIAGTNGKGSVGAFLSSIFQKAGLHVGRFCSPAVFDALEVWQYDGETISKEEYANYMSQVKNACDIMVSKGYEHPTVFEIETAMAFCYFAEKKPDIVLLETGMGGATDATNLITHPIASVLTTISYDHMQFLGERLTDIATVKAGIIKEDCPVFSATQSKEVAEVIQRVAKEKNARLFMVDAKNIKQSEIVFDKRNQPLLAFTYEGVAYQSGLAACYQAQNAALAISVAKYILQKYIAHTNTAKLPPCALYSVIGQGIHDAYWPGRFETVLQEPLFIIDGAHNEDAAKWLAATIQNCFTNMRLTYIIGVLADKEHDKMLQTMLPYANCVYTVTPSNERALDAKLLAKEAGQYHAVVKACDSVTEAVEEAIAKAHKDGNPILAFGSLSYLADVKAAVLAWKNAK